MPPSADYSPNSKTIGLSHHGHNINYSLVDSVWVVSDEDDRIFLQQVDKPLQLVQLTLHLRLLLSLVEGVGQERQSLVGLIHLSPVRPQALKNRF